MARLDTLAAIDLGSNSFHMVVGRQEAQQLRVLDALSEKVQLGAGLDAHLCLSDDVQERALACLARFAQRIAGIPAEGVRVVGTNTLRQARNATQFLARAEEVLGHPIEVIAGREEARLIYLGVAHALSGEARRLVVDIGGGSTELIIGERFEPLATESLHMGCVSYRQRFFADGSYTARAFDRAVTAARQEVLSIQADYRKQGWVENVGASGTIKAVHQVCVENGLSEGEITFAALQRLRELLVDAGSEAALELSGLREDRKPIFASGLAILYGIFEQLDIARMQVSTGALREGVLYDLMGRLAHEDIRERSIQALMQRYHVEQSQVARVGRTAQALFTQVAGRWLPDTQALAETLRWGVCVHEVGLSVSHSQFHKHGAYLVSHSDLPGFSRQDQQAVALLVRGHRRKIPLSEFAQLAPQAREHLLRLCLLLRIAARLHHARCDLSLPAVVLRADGATLQLDFPDQWLESRPLTQADLEQEQVYFADAGYTLQLNALPA